MFFIICTFQMSFKTALVLNLIALVDLKKI